MIVGNSAFSEALPYREICLDVAFRELVPFLDDPAAARLNRFSAVARIAEFLAVLSEDWFWFHWHLDFGP